MRLCGLRERHAAADKSVDDLRLEAAKQYIENNVESWVSVADIASYCYISTRQVARIFMKSENMTPFEYISERRIAHIKKLLEDDTLTLKQISDKMNFNDESYFNAFVKKHLGQPPGMYRKMNKLS